MKLLLPALLLLAAPAIAQEKQPELAAIDRPVKDFKLQNLMKAGDAPIALSDYRDKDVVVLIFTSYTCDACEDYKGRILKLVKEFQGKGVAFLGVRSSADDDAAGMRKYALAGGFEFPFLEDTKNRMAEYFDVIVTPSFYVIDRRGVLRYRGAFDEALKEARATKTYVHDALRAVLDGKEVPLKSAKAIGCHMPRVEPGK